MNKTKSFTFWFAVNKSGFVGLYSDEPIRNESTGKWDSKTPFVHSHVYDQISALVDKSGMTWENNPECITIQI